MNKNNIKPAFATHPGELIKDELRERAITQKQLAIQMGVKPSVLNEVINGKRAISLNMAKALESALEISADMWLNLQSQYELDVANEGAARKEEVTITIPIGDKTLLRELVRKFGWACSF